MLSFTAHIDNEPGQRYKSTEPDLINLRIAAFFGQEMAYQRSIFLIPQVNGVCCTGMNHPGASDFCFRIPTIDRANRLYKERGSIRTR